MKKEEEVYGDTVIILQYNKLHIPFFFGVKITSLSLIFEFSH
jgi:hypothetical protein